MRRSRMLQSVKRIMAWMLCVILLSDSVEAYALEAGEAEIAEAVCAEETVTAPEDGEDETAVLDTKEEEINVGEEMTGEAIETEVVTEEVVSSGDTKNESAVSEREMTGNDSNEIRDEAILLGLSGVITDGPAKGLKYEYDGKDQVIISGTVTAEGDEYGSWYEWKTWCKQAKNVKVTAENVTSMLNWFSDCSNIETVDLSECDLSEVDIAQGMFKNCNQLKRIDFGSQCFKNLRVTKDMFSGCYSLTGLDLSGFVSNSFDDSNDPQLDILDDCISLEWVKTPKTGTLHVELPVLMKDEAGTIYNVVKAEKESILLTKYISDESGVIDSGKYCGLDWKLKGDGTLTIFGVYNDTDVDRSKEYFWNKWRRYITAIEMSVTNLPKEPWDWHASRWTWFGRYNQLKRADLSGCSFQESTDLSNFFFECDRLEEVNFSNMDTENVINMSGMFRECISLESISLEGLDTRNVRDTSQMFLKCTSLKSINLSGVNTSNVANMQGMFEDCENLRSLDISGFDTSNVINFSYMFSGCGNLQNLSVNHFKTDKAEDMGWMFSGCGMSSLDVSRWNTENAKNTWGMFSGCSNLETLDLSSFNTSKVEDMSYMFQRCKNIHALKIDSFDTSNVKNMEYMFSGCKGLEVLDLSGFETSNLESMGYMFSGCEGLKELNVSNWDTEKVKWIYDAFAECSSLKTLDLSNFSLSSAKAADDIFSKTDNLETLKTPLNLKVSALLPHKMCDDKGKVYTELPQGMISSITLTKKKEQGGSDKPVIVLPKLEIALTDEDAEFSYTGTAVCPAVTVVVEGKTLTEGTDYTVKYSNNVNASVKVNDDGTPAMDKDGNYQPVNLSKQPTITVTAKGNYSGSDSIHFTILPKDLSEVYPDGLTVKAEEGTKPAVVLWDGGAKLAAKDYVLKNGSADSSTIYKPAAVKAGETLNLTAVGKGNYMGTAAITVTAVAKKSLNPITVTPVKSFKGFEYNGSSRKPVFGGAEGKNDADENIQVVVSSKTAPKTEEGGKGLVEGEDYYVLYSADTTNAGTVKYTVVGMGDYTGSVSKSYKINPIKAKSGLKVSYDRSKSYPFAPTGAIVDDVSVTFDNASADASTNALLNGEELTEGKDYKISYSANKKAGTGKFTATFLGNYKGSAALKNNEFTIRPVTLSELAEQGRVKVAFADKTAKKGGVYKSAPIITVDDVLVKASNYTVTYYTDEAMTTLMDKKNGKELELTAEKPSATVWVKIEGKGNYAGSAALTALNGEALRYTVYLTDGKTTGDMGKAKIALKTKSFTYTGDEITPEKSNFIVTCKVGSETVTLDESQYDIAYINNVNRGKATVLITGNGASSSKNKYTFAGSKIATFTISAKKVK